MKSLSVVVLTLNEEKHIGACLASVQSFADELVVFDSGSRDRTVQIAREAGARVETRRFDNYPGQRNAALDQANSDWIFFIDADERANENVGVEIRAEIARAEQSTSGAVLFWVPRRNYIFGKWIQHTGWSPDYQPRVLRKGRAHFDPTRPVHELVIADGSQLYLNQPLTHYNYETIGQFRSKQIRYTRFEAEQLYSAGTPPNSRGYIGQPVREFMRRFVSLQGYRDGGHGLLLSCLMAYYAFERQKLLGQMWRARNNKPGGVS